MSDQFDRTEHALDSPAKAAVAVTPHDSTNLDTPSKALYVGGAGDISVEMCHVGSAIVFVGVLAGTILPIRVTRVNDTGTDATSIVALW
jgi:hypothetical protein